jgi:hypothetical protein
MLKHVSEMTFFNSQTFSAPAEKIIENRLTYLPRNLQYYDPNGFFNFAKRMWIFFSYMRCFQSFRSANCHSTSDEANEQTRKDD